MTTSTFQRGPKSYDFGYTPVAEMNGAHADMMMDFGILRLGPGQAFSEAQELERAYLLIFGEVKLNFDGNEISIKRANCFDVAPYVLHVPANTKVSITGVCDESELCVIRTENKRSFECKLYSPHDTPNEYRGAGTMNETSTRIVRTVFDKSNAPDSNLVLGEVIGFPGKWSSYPPHHHPQPEIYYYRLNPSHGFGYAEMGEDVYKVRQNDSTFISEGMTHPHVAAPGYALWYLWVIRHLDGNPYITPIFVPEHEWVTDANAVFWPGDIDK